jgi:predicted nucleic acid-binding protein
MAASIIVDASFLITLLSRREGSHVWAESQARSLPPPWHTCEAALSESFHLLGRTGAPALEQLIRREAITVSFHFQEATDSVLQLMHKYANVPMSFADACLVRMTEVLPEPMLLTTDTDFRIYRRFGRRTIPCVMPD